MAWFCLSSRRTVGAALLGILGFWLTACQSQVSQQARAAARDVDPSLPCGEDQTREYLCDDLLPLSSSRPAPAPYDNCPSTIDTRAGAYEPTGHVAGFDKGFTEYTRKRVQPGHACCYSWCAKVLIADPAKAAPAQCGDAYGMSEKFCMHELEGGTSTPSASPYDRCPVAVKPPEVAVFSAPASALLDVSRTTQRRRDTKLAECCYGWCSKQPSGTIVHPKIK
jgi:hypothetical protein